MPTVASSRSFMTIWAIARNAGREAANAITPRPMTVVGGVPGEPPQTYHIPEGVCGFAWVTFPGNDAFGRWAKLSGLANKHYSGGLCHWISDYNQSMERKEAHARAMAASLRANGIRAYADSRMD